MVGNHETGIRRSLSPAMSNIHCLVITDVASSTNTLTGYSYFGFGELNQNGQNQVMSVCTLTLDLLAISTKVFLDNNHSTNKDNRERSRLSLRIQVAFFLQAAHRQRLAPEGCFPQRCIGVKQDGHCFFCVVISIHIF